MRISVVIPTFNRGPALARTLGAVLASDLCSSDDLEVVVVDDGSVLPAQFAIAAALDAATADVSKIVWLRQQNHGPAKARNAGFKRASGELVLFLDDDIVVPRGLVAGHAHAHRRAPGAVVFGPAHYSDPPLLRQGDQDSKPETTEEEPLVAARIVSSGHLSVERSTFHAQGGVYDETLRTPAAEEFELSARLLQRGIPVFLAPNLVAVNEQDVSIPALCRQQFKHGLGAAEAAARRPFTTVTLPELRKIVASNGPAVSTDTYKVRTRKAVKTVLSQSPNRRLLSLAAQVAGFLPGGQLLVRAAVSAHFVAGVRQGLRQFSSSE